MPRPPQPPEGPEPQGPKRHIIARLLHKAAGHWPVVRQLLHGGDGTGPEAMSSRTRNLRARTDRSQVVKSVCPYCAVGCAQDVHVRDGKVLAITGSPESPINAGHLCPKGAASQELVSHANRETRVLYRAPRAAEWTPLSLEAAMDMVAERVWKARAASFTAQGADGRPLRRTTAIAHLGGATLDIEENYLIKKLFTGGLGMVCLSNQARI